MNVDKIFKNNSKQLRSIYEGIKKAKSFETQFPSTPTNKKLLKLGVLMPGERGIVLNYSPSSCILIASTMLDELNFELPRNLKAIDKYSNRVVKKATQDGVVPGVSKFRKHLIAGLISENLSIDKGLIKEILSLQKTDRTLMTMADAIALAIPVLPLPLARLYQLHAHIYSQVHDQGYFEPYSSLQELGKTFGSKLLKLVKADNDLPGYRMNILIGIYRNDKRTAWKEIKRLDQTRFGQEAVQAIANFEFSGYEDLEVAVEYLRSIESTDLNSIALIMAITHLVNSPFATDEVKLQYGERIKKIASAHQNSHAHILRSLEGLRLHEVHKLAILNELDFKNVAMHRTLNFSSENLNPSLYFAAVRKIVLATNTHFAASEIKHSLDVLRHKEPQHFADGLMGLLTDNIGLIRFGGSRILQEVDNESQIPILQSDVLKLSEANQVRFIQAACLDFMHPRNVIRYLLPFTGSTHSRVLQCLVDSIAEIVEDYPWDTIKVLREELNQEIPKDKELLDMFEKYTSDLSEIITRKNEIQEFNPAYTAAREYAYFERLTRDKMRKQINVASDNDPLFNMVHKVSIARGKSWKIEKQETGPSPLGVISTAFTLPRVCLMNPDTYNWRFIVRINTNYKNNG